MNYTSEMEKAMQQSHGIGFKEYSRKLDKRIAVEDRREQEYQECKRIVAKFDNQIHK